MLSAREDAFVSERMAATVLAAAADYGEHTGHGRFEASFHVFKKKQKHVNSEPTWSRSSESLEPEPNMAISRSQVLSGIRIMKKSSSSWRAGPRASRSSLGVMALLLRATLGGPLLRVLLVIRKWKPKPRTEHGGKADSRLSETPGHERSDFF